MAAVCTPNFRGGSDYHLLASNLQHASIALGLEGQQLASQENDATMGFFKNQQNGVYNILQQIPDTLICDDEEDFIPPTEYARDSLIKLVTFLAWKVLFPECILSPTGSGGLRIEWHRGNRHLHMVVPGRPDGLSYIYHEDPQEYGRENEFSADALVRWLEWFIEA